MHAHRLHIIVAEVNTPSDGNRITGIPSAVEIGNKKENKFTKIVAVAHFLIFQCTFETFLMTAKAIVSAHQNGTIEQYFGWKRNYRHA